jgi:hypothetical protein
MKTIPDFVNGRASVKLTAGAVAAFHGQSLKSWSDQGVEDGLPLVGRDLKLGLKPLNLAVMVMGLDLVFGLCQLDIEFCLVLRQLLFKRLLQQGFTEERHNDNSSGRSVDGRNHFSDRFAKN